MKFQSSFAALAGVLAVASARKCQNITVPVSISSRNPVFSLPTPGTDIDMANFFLDWTRNGHNYSNEILTGYATVSGTYKIGATYCTPDSGPGQIIQLLTHGVTLDRTYWDIPVNNYNYSYVSAAVDSYNFSTFAWNLLGVGDSQSGDPVNELQSNLQNAALYELTMLLRNGGILGIGGFEKVVHVGHSYGSLLTYTLSVRYPNISDAVILTGFSQSDDFIGEFALGGNFVAANTKESLSQYPAGFLTPGSVTGVQSVFFGPGNFDPALLQYTFTTGQPATVGEMLTLAGDSGLPSPYKGPVLVITGDRDIGFCGGDCLNSGNASLASIPASTQSMMAEASPFQAFVVPNAGHVLNLEYTHPLAYQTILEFITQNVKE